MPSPIVGTWQQPSDEYLNALERANTARERYLAFEPPPPPERGPPPDYTRDRPPGYSAVPSADTWAVPNMPSAESPYWGGVSDVSEAYQDLLGRAPDDAGLAFWTNQNLKPGELVQRFQESQEYKDRIAANPLTSYFPAINSYDEAYRELLGRAPDEEGFAFWSQQPFDNSSLWKFYDSPEARAYRGSDAFKNYWTTPLGPGDTTNYGLPPSTLNTSANNSPATGFETTDLYARGGFTNLPPSGLKRRKRARQGAR